jgi:hypothetical protein
MALIASEVLKWPYGDFEMMSPCAPVGLSIEHFVGPLIGPDKAGPDKAGLLFNRPESQKRKAHSLEPQMLAGRSLRGNYISNTDRNKGRIYEDLFALAAQKCGLQVFTLPHFEFNYKKHVDFEVQNASGLSFWVDVKGPKALRKTNIKDDQWAKPQDRYVCLQLTDNGDLFGSHADYIAFGLTDGRFIVCDRLKIIECVSKCLIAKPEVGRSAWPETSLWVPYVRSFNDVSLVMTYMDLHDLKDSIVKIM